MHSRRASLPSRRGLLLGAFALAVTASCRPLFKEKPKTLPPDPDVATTERALHRTDALLASYRATADAHPGIEDKLAAFVERNEIHRRQLRSRLPAGHPAKRSPTPTAAPTPSVPKSKADAVATLVTAERKAGAALVDDTMHARSTLAQVLASMCACAYAHVELLPRVKS